MQISSGFFKMGRSRIMSLSFLLLVFVAMMTVTRGQNISTGVTASSLSTEIFDFDTSGSGMPETTEAATTTVTTTQITTPTIQTTMPLAAHCSQQVECSHDGMAFTGKGYAQYKIKKGFDRKGGVSFEFRTFASNGILFFSADYFQRDFISCFLRYGKVYFAFNTGSGNIYLSTRNVVNDGKWRKVTVYRENRDALLKVDDEVVRRRSALENGLSVINGMNYLYFGGYFTRVQRWTIRGYGPLSSKFQKKAALPISACFRKLTWHDGERFPSKPYFEKFMTNCCEEQKEKSVHFGGVNSYITLAEDFFVGRKIMFTMNIKPTSSTGLLFAFVNPFFPYFGDFVVLELNKGSVVVRIQNGDGVIETAWKPSDGATLCDGKWHKIIVSKVNSMVTLQVDNNMRSKQKKDGLGITNERNRLYVGGAPENLWSYGIKVKTSYQGCIKDFKIRWKPSLDLFSPVSISNGISMYGCPIVETNDAFAIK
ncbi:laminin subunit alpha-4-like [Dendronephthya gigantea]|uniref:laminin subunit alpha-4-like n=1 Tax=Dendronephthya gigantea TaxID=151771 RepID=UPI00106C4885|nr:laminin subunit alpha-4-like [Dendronephthya gigantea]